MMDTRSGGSEAQKNTYKHIYYRLASFLYGLLWKQIEMSDDLLAQSING